MNLIEFNFKERVAFKGVDFDINTLDLAVKSYIITSALQIIKTNQNQSNQNVQIRKISLRH